VSPRRGVLTCAVVVLLGLGALLVAGAGDERSRVFSLDVPNVSPIARLARGHQLCQGSIRSPAAFGAVQIWAQTGGAAGALELEVKGPRGTSIAQGRAALQTSPNPIEVALDAEIPAGQTVSVCVLNGGPPPIAVDGSSPLNPAMTATLDGKAVPLEISLVALRSTPRSLLALVPTIFDRAALFRPGWVGAWTFWALLVLVMLAFVVAVKAVGSAARADDLGDELPSAQQGQDSTPVQTQGAGDPPGASDAPEIGR
jgi:hypothetical protein